MGFMVQGQSGYRAFHNMPGPDTQVGGGLTEYIGIIKSYRSTEMYRNCCVVKMLCSRKSLNPS